MHADRQPCDTATGVMEPGRLFESPYTDRAPTGPDMVFAESDVEVIVEILRAVRRTAETTETS
ncbi:hypothetical protein MWU75_08565 [Ornithinimicrobium sp. F0845]|uniref:hypothetical protein n=1 Tax=Ornithinimicrobium sp. F0845 TaxID=2926412 RepID=UPI001FF1E026|nr:hypothetical protein [Ornithinimicrobium sp. F0845]MCK0112187.1 hypothetical protein [Ornithinimicrobium sp. F0845]